MTEEKFLKPSEVATITTLSMTEIKRRMKDGRFPKSIKLGKQRVAFLSTEVQLWMQDRVDECRPSEALQ